MQVVIITLDHLEIQQITQIILQQEMQTQVTIQKVIQTIILLQETKQAMQIKTANLINEATKAIPSVWDSLK